jgi:hypothetical protein
MVTFVQDQARAPFYLTPDQLGNFELNYQLTVDQQGGTKGYQQPDHQPPNSTITSWATVKAPVYPPTLIAGVPFTTNFSLTILPPASLTITPHAWQCPEIEFNPKSVTFSTENKDKLLSFEVTTTSLSSIKDIRISYSLSNDDEPFYYPIPITAAIKSLGQVQLPAELNFSRGQKDIVPPVINITAPSNQLFYVDAVLPKGLTSGRGSNIQFLFENGALQSSFPELTADADAFAKGGSFTIVYSITKSDYGKLNYVLSTHKCVVNIPANGPKPTPDPGPGPNPKPTKKPTPYPPGPHPKPAPSPPGPGPTPAPPPPPSNNSKKGHNSSTVGFVTIPLALIAMASALMAFLWVRARDRRRNEGGGEKGNWGVFPKWNPRNQSADYTVRSPNGVRRRSSTKGGSAGGSLAGSDLVGTGQEARQALLGQATGFNEADAEAWLVDLEQLEIFEEIGGGASAQVYSLCTHYALCTHYPLTMHSLSTHYALTAHFALTTHYDPLHRCTAAPTSVRQWLSNGSFQAASSRPSSWSSSETRRGFWRRCTTPTWCAFTGRRTIRRRSGVCWSLSFAPR